MSRITRYGLDAETGSILKCYFKGEDSEAKTWRIVLILDDSGSMQHVSRDFIETIFPIALSEAGVKDTEQIDVLLFSGITRQFRWTLKEFDSSECHGGGTHMIPILSPLEKLLVANPYQPFHIVVITDGEAEHRDELVNEAKQTVARITPRSAPINVCSIRARTGGGIPDTRALTCLAQLHSLGELPFHDIHMVSEESNQTAIQLIAASLKKTMPMVTLTGSPKVPRAFRRSPVDTFQTSIQIPAGQDVFLVVPSHFDYEGKDMCTSGFTYAEAKWEDESDLRDLFLFLETQIRQLMVLGNQTDKVQYIIAWVKEVMAQLPEQKTTDPVELKPDLNTRRAYLAAQLKRKEKTVSQRIRELENVSRVDQLNADLQADFLRGIGSGRQGKALARRAAKSDQAMTKEEMHAEIVHELKQFRTEGVILAEGTIKEFTSFYSQCTIAECLNSVVQAKEFANLEEFSLDDLLQLVGPIGLAYFSTRVNDAPDPWSCVHISTVWTGESAVLGTCDLWASRMQGKDSGRTLAIPGSTDMTGLVTGVVPIRAMNPVAYDLMRQKLPTLFHAHVAASLRGSLVSMPGDYPALLTYATVRLCIQAREKLSTHTVETLYLVLSDFAELQKRNQFLSADMCKQINEAADPRVYLAGDLGIFSSLKIFASILSGALQPTPKLQRALLGFEYYLAANRAPGLKTMEERAIQYRQILNIWPNKFVAVGEPLTPDPQDVKFERECDDQYILDWAKTEIIDRMTWSLQDIETVCQTAEVFHFKTSRLHCVWDDIGSGSCQAPMIIQAVLSPDLEHRIERKQNGERIYRFPDISTAEEMDKFLGDCVEGVYRAQYEKDLAQKRAKETEIKRNAAIERMWATEDMDEFLKLLNEFIPNRESPGYEKLMFAQDGKEKPVARRAEKVQMLVTGRLSDDTIVWNKGNFLRGHPLDQFRKYVTDEIWEVMQRQQQKYGVYKYRGGTVDKNRHGYSDDHPSWWAMGYKDPAECQQKDPEFFKSMCAKLEARGYRPSWMSGLLASLP